MLHFPEILLLLCLQILYKPRTNGKRLWGGDSSIGAHEGVLTLP